VSDPVDRHPVVPGFHPDPSICRVGDTYYLATSSFEYAPGVPIFRSTDLRSWEQVGHALGRPEQLDVSTSVPSGGIFAPTLRYHDGRFWLITTNASFYETLLVTATDPAGPWSDPVRLPGVTGIDPDLAWDDDGRCLCTYSGFGEHGHVGIVQSVIDPVTGELLTEREPLWQGSGGKFAEGPHLYHVGDFWYLLIAEGGTERGHAVTIARGPSPAGPWEPCPWNPLLTARGTDSPVQNTGHADLVQRADASWAIVFHGVRTRGVSPEFHVLGRETFAAEVSWQDGWPRVGAWLEPTDGAVDVDELAGQELTASWVSPRRFPAEVFRREDGGWRLTALGGDPAGDDLAFAGRRQEHLYCRVRAVVDVDDGVGGISVRIDPLHHLDLEVEGDRVRAVAQVGRLRSVLGEARTPATEPVLEIRAVPDDEHSARMGRGPDLLVAGILGLDGFTELGRLDGRYVSTEVAGGMTGRMVGAWCSSGSMVVRSLRYTGADDPDVFLR
jgi:xylan 1,4-beta-xylosidase